jgi:hydroxymethylpyrimidine kinase/phosphomethylpyrimidine kinase
VNPPVEVARPVSIVVVGGVDPGGGAGLLRDVATATVLGAHAHSVGTAWTEQGEGFHRVEPRAPEAVGAALARALATPTRRPAAVKIGMAVGPGTAAALIEALVDFAGPVVVDPVLATSRGGPLWAGAPRELLPLLRRATLVTPNAVEAAALSGLPVTTVAEAEAAGRHLVEVEGLLAVLVKGGHLADSGASVTDLVLRKGRWKGPLDPPRARPTGQSPSSLTRLVTAAAATHYPHPRLAGPSPRGTGCALATALAVELGRGRPLGQAIETAIGWLATAIAAAEEVDGERHLP